MKRYDIHEQQQQQQNKTCVKQKAGLCPAQLANTGTTATRKIRNIALLIWQKTWHFNSCWWSDFTESGYYDAAHPPGQIAQQTKTRTRCINWQRPDPDQLCGIRKGRAQCGMSSAEQLILGNDDTYSILQPSASIRIPQLSRHLGPCCLQTRDDGGKRKWLFNQWTFK